MHVISRKMLRDFAKVHPASESALEAWYQRAKDARWNTFADVRADYPWPIRSAA